MYVYIQILLIFSTWVNDLLIFENTYYTHMHTCMKQTINDIKTRSLGFRRSALFIDHMGNYQMNAIGNSII